MIVRVGPAMSTMFRAFQTSGTGGKAPAPYRRFVGALLAHSGVRCLLSRVLDPAHFRRAVVDAILSGSHFGSQSERIRAGAWRDLANNNTLRVPRRLEPSIDRRVSGPLVESG